jgi:Putative sterol carrier protein
MSIMGVYDTLSRVVELVNSDPAVKGELKGFGKVFQFDTGVDKFYVSFNQDGSISISKGQHPNPSATLSGSEEVMEGIVSGKVDAVSAFFQGKLKVSGDIMSAQRLASIMSRARK